MTTLTQAKRSDREAAFDQWWNLSVHNGTLPDHRKNLAREAYYAAWGGGALSALERAPSDDAVEAAAVAIMNSRRIRHQIPPIKSLSILTPAGAEEYRAAARDALAAAAAFVADEQGG